jgi:tetratricopeptide (TPR) repeat protein
MANLQQHLEALEQDPYDAAACSALTQLGAAQYAAATSEFARRRHLWRERGQYEALIQLLDIEIEITRDPDRQADLLLEKGEVLKGDLLEESAAIACFDRVLALRPSDATAQEALQQMQLISENWQRFIRKYVDEASASTDRQLATSLYLSAAELCARQDAGSAEAETYLIRALEVDPRNRRAAAHLERRLRRSERWAELATFLGERVDSAVNREERVAILVQLAQVAQYRLGDLGRTRNALTKAIAIDPANPLAVRQLADLYAEGELWAELAALYQGALRARRSGEEDDLGLLLQVGMILWKRLDDLEHAEEYFRRLRRLDPVHPAMLDFYRAYHGGRGEQPKLLQILRQAEKSLGSDPRTSTRQKALAIEIAELAEGHLGSSDKAIETWKALLRSDPSSADARGALRRLYRKSEKWNALLDLIKEEAERLSPDDVAGRVERAFEAVEIYRDHLKLDGMVISTYLTIGKLDPDNVRAMEQVATKYRELGRWNDLIAVLARRAELTSTAVELRVELLREVAQLWTERFGNFAQAAAPLEKLLELSPHDHDAIHRLKDIYLRRRQWRGLIQLLGREAEGAAPVIRRDRLGEMARLAAERLGDQRLAIGYWNQVLEEAGADDDVSAALQALAVLYDREKRWFALVEILRRQRAATQDRAEAVHLLERIGSVLADRLAAPAPAAASWEEILGLDPDHAKALRMLRELYAQARNWGEMERLYVQLGHEDELIDALISNADRIEDRDGKLSALERAASVAQRRADSAARADSAERAMRVWERLLAVDPSHERASRQLAPMYEKQEKWPKVLAALEVQLRLAGDDDARRRLIEEIRQLCEHRLGSRSLAFSWTMRAFALAPGEDKLRADAVRLAFDREQLAELASAFEGELARAERGERKLSETTRVGLLRGVAHASAQLARPEKARGYWQQVLALVPGDPAAMVKLEELSVELSDWTGLLSAYRRRIELAKDDGDKVDLLLDAAVTEEERLVDLDAAVATYQEVLELQPSNLQALRALIRLHDARGDWEGLLRVLRWDLEHATDPDARFALCMRMGQLQERSLGRPEGALGDFRAAYAIVDRNGIVRPAALAAVVRYLDPLGIGADLAPLIRCDLAELVLPELVRRHDPGGVARSLEIIRGIHPERLGGAPAIDRRLLALYLDDIDDPARAWEVGLRLLAADPSDFGVRYALTNLAAELGRDGELARVLGDAISKLHAQGGHERDIRALALEVAEMSSRVGDSVSAEKAWLAALRSDPTSNDAYAALAALYRKAARWRDLVALWEEQLAAVTDSDVRKATLLELASIEEQHLGNVARTVEIHQRVLEIDPRHAQSYQVLHRLLSEAERWGDLDRLLAEQLDHVADRVQTALRFQRAELKIRHLSDLDGAVDLLEEVVARQRSHSEARELLEELLTSPLRQRIARVLEALYETDQLWKDLVIVLRVQREQYSSGAEAVAMLMRIAEVEERRLDRPRAAFDTWAEILAIDAGDMRARAALSRLATALDRWPDAIRLWRAAADGCGDLEVKVTLLTELAGFYSLQTGDVEGAIATHREILALAGDHLDASRRASGALIQLLEGEERWTDLCAALRAQAAWADSEERRGLLSRIADIEENRLQDRAAAAATWQEMLDADPQSDHALAALARLYESDRRWREFIQISRRRVLLALDTASAKASLLRIAHVTEHELGAAHDAVAVYLDILDGDEDDEDALRELSRLHRSEGRFDELFDVLERRLARSSTGNFELELELARLLSGPLGRPADALERWAALAGREPSQAEAIAALERGLEDSIVRPRAAELLRPVYEHRGAFAQLADLCERMAASAESREQVARLREAAAIREQRLADRGGALRCLLAAVSSSGPEDGLVEILHDVERLAGDLGRTSELIDAYRPLADRITDAELRRRLHLDIADLARAVRGDKALALEYYQKVLATDPDDRRVLVALEGIYRETRDYTRLWETLVAKSEVFADRLEERLLALTEAAQLAAGVLAQPDQAITLWEQVLELAPERADAASALEQLYEQRGRFQDLASHYDRRLGFVESIDQAVALRLRAAMLNEGPLADLDAAIENYEAALGGDPDNAQALAALERYLSHPDVGARAADALEPQYVSRQNWTKLAAAYDIKLAAATDPQERLRLTRFMARLYEDQLEDLEGATRWYAKVFRENPADPQVREQLQRLTGIVENWGALAAVYQEYLDGEAGEAEHLRPIALVLAGIYERRLGDLDRAQHAYRRGLRVNWGDRPGEDREILPRLEGVLIRGGQWSVLSEVYEEALSHIEIAGERRDILAKRARLFERELGDLARAIDAWREVAALCEPDGGAPERHAHAEAVSELERLFHATARFYDLSDLLQSQLGRPGLEEQELDLRMRLGAVLETGIKDLGGAVDQYERVADLKEGLDRALPCLERLVVVDQLRERIARHLEPVYRDRDWWQKLVVILDAKLSFVDDAAEKILILGEIADLHEKRGGDLGLAFTAVSMAWLLEVGDVELFARLDHLATQRGAWEDLAAVLATGMEKANDKAIDGETIVSIGHRLATVLELHRADVDGAIAVWRRVLEASGDDTVALAALDRLLSRQTRPDELVKVLERRADLAEEQGGKIELLHRVAALYRGALHRPDDAITVLRAILALDDGDRLALELLTGLLADSGNHRDRCEILRRRIELGTDRDLRRQLRLTLAEVAGRDLGDIFEAITQYCAVLAEYPGDVVIMQALEQIYERERMWPELLDMLDRRAAVITSPLDRADVLFRAARLVELQQVDPDAAIPRYGAALHIAPYHPGARSALMALADRDDYTFPASEILEQVYRNDSDGNGLVGLFERRLRLSGLERSVRRDQWVLLADAHEFLRNDARSAFDTWARAFVDEPSDLEVLGPLERLAGVENRWTELAALVEKQLASAASAELEHDLAMRLGAIYEDALSDLVSAARAFEIGVNTGIDEANALSALERVFSRLGRWADLARVIDRRANSTTDDGPAADNLFRLGDLRENALTDTSGAIAAYREALARVPGHAASRAALERILHLGEHVTEVAEVLEPLYEHDQAWAKLHDVLLARTRNPGDRGDKVSLYQRMVELADRQLRDPSKAFDAALAWLREDPDSVEASEEVGRLASVRGSWAEVTVRMIEIAENVDETTRDKLLLQVAAIQHQRLHDPAAAARTYEFILAQDEHAIAALEGACAVYRELGQRTRLAQLEWRRGKESFDPEVKRQSFALVAQLRQQENDLAGAEEAWRAVLDLDDADRRVLAELATVLERAGRAEALMEILGRSAELADSPAEEKVLRVRIARLCEQSADLVRAVRAWQAVVDADPIDDESLAALEDVFARAADWPSALEVMQRRLDLAQTKPGKIAILARMALVAEERLLSREDAVGHWRSILELDNTHPVAYEQLERLLGATSRWHDLVELLERRAELEGTMGNSGGEVRLLVRTADVWEDKLGNPEAAGEILEKILRRDPSSVVALTRLARTYERNGDWDRCGEVLQKALALGPKGEDAADLFFRLGETARKGIGDLDTAVAHFRQALHHHPAHVLSQEALEALARERGDRALLEQMLRLRLERLVGTDRRVVLIELAECERKAGQVDPAIVLLEEAARLSPGDPSVLSPLADLLVAAGRPDQAAPLLERLADEARTARRMKDVARYRQRQAAILEARGDTAAALVAYEEAFRVNPTDVATMAGLGRLYFSLEEWEKARRVYRALVVQTVDADSGVNKADAYWALGFTHAKLGEGVKARGLYQRGLEIEPNNERLKRALAELG